MLICQGGKKEDGTWKKKSVSKKKLDNINEQYVK
jgi:hypothetical protein